MDFCGTIYSNRNELCGMQQQSGKGSIEGIGSYQLFGQSSDEFHGSRRNRIPVGDHCGCWGSRIRCFGKRSRCRSQKRRSNGWGCPERQGDTDYEASSDRITVFSDSTDVHFHGSYDVELAIAGISGWQSCSNGTDPAVIYRNYHGDQPEVLHQWI